MVDFNILILYLKDCELILTINEVFLIKKSFSDIDDIRAEQYIFESFLILNVIKYNAIDNVNIRYSLHLHINLF